MPLEPKNNDKIFIKILILIFFRDLTTDDNSKVYFLSIVDVLTYYGVKKVAAKAAKTMKYGSGVDGEKFFFFIFSLRNWTYTHFL